MPSRFVAAHAREELAELGFLVCVFVFPKTEQVGEERRREVVFQPIGLGQNLIPLDDEDMLAVFLLEFRRARIKGIG